MVKVGAIRRAGVFALALAGAAAEGPSQDELAAAGRRLYREGRLGSGQAVTALVQGDVPVLGTQVTCQSCHGLSGMGAIEGGRISSPVAGPLLFSADTKRRRPAYTEVTLARVLREGVDSAGRSVDPLMPRFQLGDQDMKALAAYLRQLSATPSPGIGRDSLNLATIVAGDVASARERAVLDTIEAYVADRNRSGRQRLRGGHAPGQPKETFREWSLDVWRLSGPPESWRAQIAARYRERPAFAVVGGLSSETWQPIHDFCEAEQVPCLFPDIDLPPADEGGFYSFYFSRGLRLEAEIIAATLAEEKRLSNVVGIVEGDRSSPSGEAARALAQAIERRGGRMRTVDVRQCAGGEDDVSAIVLWLKADTIQRLAVDLGARSGGPPLFVSSTLLGAPWDDLPAAVRKRTRAVHLSALPGEADRSLDRFRTWARVRSVQIREERHQAMAYFAFLAFAESTKHLGNFMFRDYFLDLLEHASNLSAYLPLYLRAGITPGQRLLSRGGYMVDLSGRLDPVWLVP